MCTIHHATTAIALFSFSCNMQRVMKLWSSHMNSARVSTSSEEVRNFNKQNKYATSWAPVQDNSRAIANGERPLLAEVLLK